MGSGHPLYHRKWTNEWGQVTPWRRTIGIDSLRLSWQRSCRRFRLGESNHPCLAEAVGGVSTCALVRAAVGYRSSQVPASDFFSRSYCLRACMADRLCPSISSAVASLRYVDRLSGCAKSNLSKLDDSAIGRVEAAKNWRLSPLESEFGTGAVKARRPMRQASTKPTAIARNPRGVPRRSRAPANRPPPALERLDTEYCMILISLR